MLKDEKASVRYGAALALSSVGDVSAIEQLKLASKDDSLMVRQIAEFAIEEIDQRRNL
jgi:HEAT repeat protein